MRCLKNRDGKKLLFYIYTLIFRSQVSEATILEGRSTRRRARATAVAVGLPQAEGNDTNILSSFLPPRTLSSATLGRARSAPKKKNALPSKEVAVLPPSPDKHALIPKNGIPLPPSSLLLLFLPVHHPHLPIRDVAFATDDNFEAQARRCRS